MRTDPVQSAKLLRRSTIFGGLATAIMVINTMLFMSNALLLVCFFLAVVQFVAGIVAAVLAARGSRLSPRAGTGVTRGVFFAIVGLGGPFAICCVGMMMSVVH